MTVEEYTRRTLAMSETEWFAHDLTEPCAKGTKRCIASHKISEACILLGPPRVGRAA